MNFNNVISFIPSPKQSQKLNKATGCQPLYPQPVLVSSNHQAFLGFRLEVGHSISGNWLSITPITYFKLIFTSKVSEIIIPDVMYDYYGHDVIALSL